jgi:hypothetical protein
MRSSVLMILFFYLFLSESFAQTFEWAFRAGGEYGDTGEKIATDKKGNIYAIGTYMRSGDFGSFPLSSYSSTIYLAKFNSEGKPIWLNLSGKTIGNSNRPQITVDAEGNSYVTGRFGGTVTFEGQNNTDVVLSSPGIVSVFLIKYDTDGKILWSQRSYGGPAMDMPDGIALDSEGNCIITGSYSGEVKFGHITITSYDDPITTRPPAYGMFLAKYSSEGIFLWVKSASSAEEDEWPNATGQGLVIDSNDNIITGGTFQGKINFSGIIIESTKGGQFYDNNIFFAKYTPSGDLLWVKREGNSNYVLFKTISIDRDDNFYITGYTGDPTIIANTHMDVRQSFLVKFNNEGSPIWVKKVVRGTWPEDVAIDNAGNFFLIGNLAYTTTFGEGINEKTLTFNENDKYSFYAAKFNNKGEFIWDILPKGIGNGGGSGRGICTDLNNNVFLTGSFILSVAFGNTTLTAAEGTYSAEDIFIAKIKDDGTTAISRDIKEKTFNIYPNPARNKLNIHYQPKELTGNINFHIYNSTGALVHSAILPYSENISQSIDISSFSSGVYFVNLIDGEERVSRKFVVGR